MTGPSSPLARPIKRESISDMVARRLLDMVTAGDLKPGDQLPVERELAQALDVSRSSVREAIRGLSILGVLNVRQGGGAYVSELDAAALLGPIQFYLALEEMNVRQLYDARMLIESDVARRAAVAMSDEELDKLGTILQDQRATLGDPNAFRSSDHEFHKTIWTGSGNAFLKRIGESLNVIGLDFRRRASETEGVLAQSHKDHLRLFEALRQRDADASAEAAARHMRNVYRSTIAQETGEASE